jgi:hypothetical protein
MNQTESCCANPTSLLKWRNKKRPTQMKHRDFDIFHLLLQSLAITKKGKKGAHTCLCWIYAVLHWNVCFCFHLFACVEHSVSLCLFYFFLFFVCVFYENNVNGDI